MGCCLLLNSSRNHCYNSFIPYYMILLKKYESLEDALLLLKKQVADSIPYAEENIPEFDDPEELFDWMKDRVTFINDPKGRELFQSMETFVEGSRMGVPWGGDCDCFTISALAALIVNSFAPVWVILVGREPDEAVHIYAGVGDDAVPFDLTNDEFGYERDEYSYKQVLPFNL